MATLPQATTIVDAESGGSSSGADVITVIAPVPLNADGVPRRFGSAKAVFSFHGYSEGVEYVAEHVPSTGKPVLFCGIPIETEGTVGAFDTSGNSGTSVSTVSAVAGGCLTEHDGVLTVVTGGTIGTSQIVLGLSLDGGRTTKKVRLGTANSYTIPYVGVQVAFAAGTLVAGDTIHTWHGIAPKGDADGIALARTELAKTQYASRSWLVIGDAEDADEATAVVTQANNYASANSRFTRARVAVRDQLSYAALSRTTVRSTATSVTFAEVGGTGDTITRAIGSFVTDGFMVGDMLTITDTPSGTNNITGAAKVTGVTATVLTLDTDDLAVQGPVAATIIGTPSLTFANTGDTITRNRGSWLADGFRVGQTVTIDGTAGGTNDGSFAITALTSTVMTLASGGVDADEVIRTSAVTIATGETKTEWLTNIEDEFSDVDGEYRVSLGLGRARKLSQFTGYMYRRPSQWPVAVREYQHDYHIATWKKDEGPLSGWTINDADGNLAEYDDRVDGEFASAARFTSLRTWANGPGGCAVSQDLTRAEDGSVLAYCHNVDVLNLAQTTVQRATENLIGRSITLNDDGTATSDELKKIASEVNRQLQRAVLVSIGEGVRASKCVWTPSTDDILSGTEALLTGTLELNLNGTIHSVTTTIKVR
jgi:hypothetical protein